MCGCVTGHVIQCMCSDRPQLGNKLVSTFIRRCKNNGQ